MQVGLWAGAAYSVVCERDEALAYPLLCVDIADRDVQCDEDHETQEDGPLDDEALLSRTVSSRWFPKDGPLRRNGRVATYSRVPVWYYTAVLNDEAVWRSRGFAAIFRCGRGLPLYEIGVHLG